MKRSKNRHWRYIYGPVSSWRLGRSLGIDLLSRKEKICNSNCIYCQLGRTVNSTAGRGVFVPTSEVIKELKTFPEVKVDYITFSGRGEPTLARNLGEVIKAVKRLRREPVAVLTNSLLMHRKDVARDLMLADFVMAKLDSFSQGSLCLINAPVSKTAFVDILNGIKRFRKLYKKKLALQIMFVEENKRDADKLARLCREIAPDEVQINTPLRPCPARPLSKRELSEVKGHFKGLKTVSVYDIKRKETISVSQKETLKRRGKP